MEPSKAKQDVKAFFEAVYRLEKLYSRNPIEAICRGIDLGGLNLYTDCYLPDAEMAYRGVLILNYLPSIPKQIESWRNDIGILYVVTTQGDNIVLESFPWDRTQSF